MADRARNFKAMRDDRVLAMASREFGRSFANADDARKALSALPIDRQRALKKPVSPNLKAIQQAHQMTQAGQESRYVNRMTAAGSAKSPEQLVAEFNAKRMETAKPTVSSKRGKALLKEGVVTRADIKGASSWADVERLAGQGRNNAAYDRGMTPRMPAAQWDPVARGMSKTNQTMLQLEREIASLNAAPAAAGQSAVMSGVKTVGRYASSGLLAISVGAAAVQGFQQARDHGDSVGVSAVKGALNAAPAAFVAGAPYIEKGASAFAEGAFAVSRHLWDQAGLFDFVVLDAAFGKAALATGAAGMLSKGVALTAKIASKAALPAALAVGAVMGAAKDENRLRGAARGIVSTFDPTALVMNKGLAERGFNAVFGEQDRPISAQPRLNRDNPDAGSYKGRGYLNSAAQRRAEAPASPSAPALKLAAGPVLRSDGQTEAYTRINKRSGKAISVSAYTTPLRT